MSSGKSSKIKELFGWIIILAAFVFFAVIVYGAVSSATEAHGSEAIDYIRVGLKHSTDVVEEYTFTTDYGLEYGVQSKTTDSFTPLGICRGDTFSVKKATGFYSVAIFAYEKNGERIVERDELLSEVQYLIGEDEVEFFEHFSDKNGYEIRLGSFATREETEKYLMKIALRLEGKLETLIIFNDENTVYLFDESGKVICGYTGNDPEYAFCVIPLTNIDETVYLKCESLIYEGSLEFRRVTTEKYDGVSVINVVPTDRYIACVMSYEISPSSHHEVHKAFSIAVRNYTYNGENKHKTANFDLCCDTHCQAYRGSGRLNESIVTSVKETAGNVILTKDGEFADIYYSSTAGGCTVAVEDTWNTEAQSHLIAFPTPWEKYRDYNSYTSWTVEYTPYELYEKIKNDCPEIKGDIAKVEIELCEDSPHVYSITYTDIYGNKATVSGTTTLRVMLGLYSGCFVVGKGGETVKRKVYSYDCFDNVYSPTYQGPLGIKVEKELLVDMGDSLSEEEIEKLKAFVEESFGSSSKFMNGSFEISENGTVMVSAEGESLHFTENGLPDLFSAKTVIKEYDVTLEGEEGNFVFDGMGWGHGVGLSQNGLKELVNLGYDYKTILEVYFPGAKVTYVG